jgi:hypothetical protein
MNYLPDEFAVRLPSRPQPVAGRNLGWRTRTITQEDPVMSNGTTAKKRRATALGLTVAFGVILTLAACTPTSSEQPQAGPEASEVNPAGDIPDDQVFVTFTADSGDYSVKVPEGWARTDNGPSTTFTDKLNSITVEETSADTAPTVESARQNEVASIQASSKKFELGDVKPFERAGGGGVEVTYQEDSAANEVTGTVQRDAVQLFLFWKNGRQVALTLSGPRGADNVDPWNIVTKSFTWLS